jgi:hypothetical protein
VESLEKEGTRTVETGNGNTDKRKCRKRQRVRKNPQEYKRKEGKKNKYE